ncbi:MAG: hypothetical protein JHC95_08820 [Solirubrobacteraceae bacterium]|nr:hypothetical protein [Solirubrobacteraceae bacterium]
MLVRSIAPAACVGLLALSGCGGDDKQDASDRAGTYEVEVASTMQRRQQLSRQTTLRVLVRNTGSEAIPNVAVSLAGLNQPAEQRGIADPQKPVWIVDNAPRAGVTAYVSTWALGKLEPNGVQEYTWKLTPIEPGTHKLAWRVAGNLTGTAETQTADGEVPEGEFTVRVRERPPRVVVNPATGAIVRPDR